MSFISYLGTLFLSWLKLYAAPFTNFELLWIIIPIYINWIFTEIYQEKKGTSFGNAISNGVVPLWVGIDWGRVTVRMLLNHQIGFDAVLAAKFGIITFMIIYGLAIIILGIQVKKITRYIGRIREISYVSLMLTPVFYGVAKLSLTNLLAMLIFFPLFYGIIELICRVTPNPQSIEDDEMPDLGADIPSSKSLDAGLPDLGNLPGGKI